MGTVLQALRDLDQQGTPQLQTMKAVKRFNLKKDTTTPCKVVPVARHVIVVPWATVRLSGMIL